METGRKIRVIELFGGIGACTQALKRHGLNFEVVDYVEVDKYPVASYNAMNDTNFIPQDISKWDKDVTDIDLIMHGSPCQDFSIAGHGKGGDEGSGTRSSLMYETLRIVDKVKPRIVIWENVKGLLSPKHRHNYDAYLQRMSDMGYTNHYQVLNAKDYGVPQNRERIFTVSFLESGIDFKFPEKQELKIRLRDILENWVDDKFYLSDKMMEKITWDTKSNEIIEVANLHKGGERGPVISPEGICSCLSATEYKQPKQIVDPSIDMIGMLNIKGNEQVRRVYGSDGISPTLNTMGGGNRQPKVLVKEATKKGYAEAEIGDSINLEQPNSLTRRGRVGHGVAQTITTSCQQAVVEPKENVGYTIWGGMQKHQAVKTDGIVPCLTSSMGSGGGYVPMTDCEPVYEQYGEVTNNDMSKYYLSEKGVEYVTDQYRLDHKITQINGDVALCLTAKGNQNWTGTFVSDDIEPINTCSDGNSRTIKAQYYKNGRANFIGPSHGATAVQCGLRIRKLTPLECWRLMGFDDEVFYKAMKVNSNTQLYKEAGNSIVVNVLYEIIRKLLECNAL